jgi:hypothetical protein
MSSALLTPYCLSRIAAKFHAEDLHVARSEAVVQPVDETVDCAGNSIWMSVTKMPLRDDKGELIAVVSRTRGNTARKHAEELREKDAPLEDDLPAARQVRPTGHLRRRNAFSKTTIRPGSGSRFSNSHSCGPARM